MMSWLKTSRFTWVNNTIPDLVIQHCGHPTAIEPYYASKDGIYLTAWDYYPVYEPWHYVERSECQNTTICAWRNLKPLQRMLETLYGKDEINETT